MSTTIRTATLTEVAELLRVSKRTVVRMVDAGALPALNMPGRLRFDLNEVEATLRGRRSAA